jgi:hypothetical protein
MPLGTGSQKEKNSKAEKIFLDLLMATIDSEYMGG